jgi:steroid delta-isomerase-like uncharacterized protein
MSTEQQQLRRERRRAVVHEHMEAEIRHDWDGVIATFAKPRYELIGTSSVFDGEDAVRGYFNASRRPFPDQSNEMIEMHYTDTAIITEFWLIGTHLGDLPGLAATGKAFRVQMLAIFEFNDDDLITCERVYFDRKSLMDQLTRD